MAMRSKMELGRQEGAEWPRGRIMPGRTPSGWKGDCYLGGRYGQEFAKLPEYGQAVANTSPNCTSRALNSQKSREGFNRHRSGKLFFVAVTRTPSKWEGIKEQRGRRIARRTATGQEGISWRGGHQVTRRAPSSCDGAEQPEND